MKGFLTALLAVVLCTGCFVFDELEEGDKLMQQLGPGKQAAKTAPAEEEAPVRTASKRQGPGVLERVRGWWDEATEPEAPPSHAPDDHIVRCTVGGEAQFMRKSDCQLRGGRVAGS